PLGTVLARGEDWTTENEGVVDAGERVEVTPVAGLRPRAWRARTGIRRKESPDAGGMGRRRDRGPLRAERAQSLARVRAGGRLSPRAPGRRSRPGPRLRDPGHREGDPHRSAHDHHGRPVAGRDHQGQRLAQGERGPLLRVIDANRAVTAVENFLFATSQNAQTTLRSVCGEAELDELLAEREKINTHLQAIIDQHTDPWGIKVVQVAIKHIDLPEEMRRAMARQAEAERERRAKVIAAEGEYQAAQRLADASAI